MRRWAHEMKNDFAFVKSSEKSPNNCSLAFKARRVSGIDGYEQKKWPNYGTNRKRKPGQTNGVPYTLCRL